jgi:type III secretion protein D
MDRAAPPVESLHALELRVLAGAQHGARAPLAAGVPCLVAAEPDGAGEAADIVLREDKLPPSRVRVCAELTRATLEVLTGEVLLGNEVLKAGAQATWTQHTPLKIGTSVIAFGRACIDDWKAGAPIEGLADSTAPAGDTPATTTRKPLRQRAEVWLACVGASVLVVCAGALGMARVAAAPPPPQVNEALQLTQALRGTEFSTLEVGRTADGRVALRGRLGVQAQRSKLDAWLAGRAASAPVVVDVMVDEAVAREVAEMFRINGIAVQAEVAGPGRIVAQAAEHDATRLARAEEVVRRDVRGLEQLTVRNTAKPLPPPPPPVNDDPNKRIASLVPGEPAYLVTADGARYFIGALLPTGHRITQIEHTRVTLERDGHQSTLTF